MGTERSPASDFGRPMALKRSARCRTCIALASKSTSTIEGHAVRMRAQAVKMAVTMNGRNRPRRLHDCASPSPRVGMSSPIFRRPLSLLSACRSLPRPRRPRISRTTFRATRPRSCASAKSPETPHDLAQHSGASAPLRRSRSSSPRTIGGVSLQEHRPYLGRDVQLQVRNGFDVVVRSRPAASDAAIHRSPAVRTVALAR